MDIPIISFLLSLLLSGHGLRKRSLSLGGAATAFFVGLFTMAGGTRVFGVALIGFYLVGSRATKCKTTPMETLNIVYWLLINLIDGKDKKSRLEDGYHEAGHRSGWQVLSNSFTALLASFLWNAAFAPNSIHSSLLRAWNMNLGRNLLQRSSGAVAVADGTWCTISDSVGEGWSRLLIFVALGHFACCMGDTLASELGILSRSWPVLITTFKPVPPGTNGGVSAWGTFVSIAGGGFVGFLIGMTLIFENRPCRLMWNRTLADTVVWGFFAGGFGSLVDSLLGATLQQTRYSKDKKLILQDSSRDDGQIISGFGILTNNQVNVVSSAICAGVVGWTVGR
ncbi:integral membrane protein DUF92-domain-containing protein [Crepidotus variabilis]|uniref:Integral membrane protein DUF92-domain-containing protein n=1 Tax=Crepidotus variabilis TaxID=179855 RepID=A0A9P6EJK7_9AGAR|nr:integral membrane protein DUF92-domain-containing protein [Crepidotus variabilis]